MPLRGGNLHHGPTVAQNSSCKYAAEIARTHPILKRAIWRGRYSSEKPSPASTSCPHSLIVIDIVADGPDRMPKPGRTSMVASHHPHMAIKDMELDCDKIRPWNHKEIDQVGVEEFELLSPGVEV